MKINKIFKLSAIALICLLLQIYIYPADDNKDEIIFKWAFIQRRVQNDMVIDTNMDFSKDVKVKSDDVFVIYIEPIQNAYVYLYIYDAQDKLSLSFPYEFKNFDKKDYMKKEYYVPEKEDNSTDLQFQLDKNKGTERFLLLVSKTRLSNLENLTNKYLSLLDSNSTNKMLEAKQKVLDEIKKIKLKNSKFLVLAEKPSPMAGVARALLKESAFNNSVKVESKGFYERTFRLIHE